MWRRLLAVETLPIDGWHDCRTRRSTRSIATELKHETLPTNRVNPTARSCVKVDCTMYQSTGMRHAAGALFSTVIIRSWPPRSQMHDDQGPVEKEGRDGSPLKLLTWPFGRWTIRFFGFPSPLHASEGALRILAKRNWKIESFLWGR